MKKLCSLFLSLSILITPMLVSAQSGYGQALGSRRQQTRALTRDIGRSFGTQGSSAQGFSDGSSSFELDGSDQRQMGMGRQQMLQNGYQVHILGQIEFPGTYRLAPSMRLDEAITVAGREKERGSIRRVQLRRGTSRKHYDLLQYRRRGALSQNPFLIDNDVVFIPYSEKNVAIQGAVKDPGTYELLTAENSLLALVDLAGGYSTGVSRDTPVHVIRYKGSEKQLLEIQHDRQRLETFELQNGDVVVIPHVLTAGRDFDYNIASLPADTVFYPSFNDNVFVIGSVELPGAYRFNPHYSMREFVNMAGPMREAKNKSAFILTADGRRIQGRQVKKYKVSPGDTIIVPEKAWTSDNVIKWYNTLANSIITGFTLRELIRN